MLADSFSKLSPDQQVEVMKNSKLMFNTLVFLNGEMEDIHRGHHGPKPNLEWMMRTRNAIRIPGCKTIAELRRFNCG